MKFTVNPLLSATASPPVPEVQNWVHGRPIPPDLPLIDLVQAVPGYPPDASLTKHLADRINGSELHLYTPIEGLPELRQSLAAELRDAYGAHIPEECILITAGCNQAFFAAVMALARPGDTVLLPTPFYFNHQMTLDMLGITSLHLPAHAARQFRPDPNEAEAMIQPGTKALVLVTPNNPTGAIYPPRLLERFFALAERRKIALILDETYRDFLPAAAPRPHELFHASGWVETLIHMYSFSKAYSLAGYRVGALVASPDFLSEVIKIMDCMAICAPHAGQVAAQFGVERLADWRRGNRTLMAERMEAFREAMANHTPAWKICSIGTYFAYVSHPFRGWTSLRVAQLLAGKQNLLTLPGSVFGPGQEEYLRLAFANVDASRMPEIARRLGDCSTP